MPLMNYWNCLGYLSLSLAALALAPQPPGHTAPLNAPQSKGPLQIDGRLDEESWKEALLCSPLGYMKATAPRHEPAPTEVRLMADKEAVYVGFICHEPEMAKLLATPRFRDGAVWEDDCVEVFLSPAGTPTNFYQFMLSAGGVQFDNQLVENGKLSGPPYSSIWQSAVHKDNGFWSAEIRIPLSAFSRTNSAQFSTEWLVNVTRERKPVYELTSWAPVEHSFAESEKYHKVSGMPQKPASLDLQIISGVPHIEAADGSGSLKLQLSAGAGAAGSYKAQIKNSDTGAIIHTAAALVKTGESAVSIDKVKFPALGKQNFELALTNGAGELVAGTYVTSNLVYQPLQIDISEPFYAGCIFPDETLRRIAGSAKINSSPQLLKGAVLQVSLKNAAHQIVKTASIPVTAGKTNIPFALETGVLPIGTFTLQVRVQKNGQELAKAMTTIRKLAAPEGSSVRLDRNLNLMVNGSPIFPHTWMGGATFHVSRAIQEGMQHPSPYVNLWNLQVNAEPLRLDPEEGPRSVQDVKPSQRVLDGIRQAYEKNRARKDAWAYYLADEPEGSGMSLVYLKHCYDFIKEMDPYHPVQIASHAPQNFVSVCDIVTPDSYINPIVTNGRRSLETPMQIVRQDVGQAVAAAKGKTAVWVMPQAFNYAGPLAGRTGSDMPTFHEFRCVVFDAIANGAKGVMPFYYGEQFSSWEMRYGVDFVFESLARLQPILLAPQTPMPLSVQGVSVGVDAWAKEADGNTLLIAANTLDKEVTVQIKGEGLKKLSSMMGFQEELSVPVKNGELSLTLAPYQVNVLTAKKMDVGLRSVKDMQQQIDIAKRESQKPGNILYGRGKEMVWTASDDYIATASLWTLTDGITDNLGWANIRGAATDTSFVEMAFPTFTPRFSKAKIYSATVEDLDFYIWKAGEWQKVGEVRGANGQYSSLDFGRELSTVKIKIVIPKTRAGEKAELTEIELYAK